MHRIAILTTLILAACVDSSDDIIKDVMDKAPSLSELPQETRCLNCGTDSDDWLDPSSPAAQPYLAQITTIDPTLATGETTCRHNEFVTGCCVVGANKVGVCCALANGQPVCQVVSGDYYYEWLWSF